MRIPVSAVRRSAAVKATVIAILPLALLIPVQMIKGIVFDRQHNESVAIADIEEQLGP